MALPSKSVKAASSGWVPAVRKELRVQPFL
jgi:hypothetical protein